MVRIRSNSHITALALTSLSVVAEIRNIENMSDEDKKIAFNANFNIARSYFEYGLPDKALEYAERMEQVIPGSKEYKDVIRQIKTPAIFDDENTHIEP